MSQITLQFENDSIKRHFLKIIELMDGVSVVKPQARVRARKSGLEEALEDVKSGRISEYASVDDFFNKISV